MDTGEKILKAYTAFYFAALFTVLGVHSSTNPRENNLEQTIIQEEVKTNTPPTNQVNNYQWVNPWDTIRTKYDVPSLNPSPEQ